MTFLAVAEVQRRRRELTRNIRPVLPSAAVRFVSSNEKRCVFRIRASWPERLQMWRAVWEYLKDSPFCPVYVEHVDLMFLGAPRDVGKRNAVPSETLIYERVETAKFINVKDWLGATLSAHPEWVDDLHGSWPNETRSYFHSLFSDRHESASLLLVEADHPWHLPAILNIGLGNLPPMAAHVSVLEYLHEKYGAELFWCSYDSFEVVVRQRPASLELAEREAQVLWAYCHDLVGEITQSLEELATSLLHSDVWKFWWD